MIETKTEELLLNRYKVLSKLGRGGFADVYEAFDTRMERVVAIKRIPLNRYSADRVLREARTVALLNHPNIVTIHEFEEDGDGCYLIMELVDGISLSRVFSKTCPLSEKEAIAIAIEICRALEAAHASGVIHRDIKPENVMIMYDGRLKVMDFGIATLKGSSTAIGSDIVGTFSYMSPEQSRGDVVDERSDIYSLGVVLYEMLTDSIPFSGETSVETLSMVQNLEPAPPSHVNPSLDDSLDLCVMTALAKSPHERYESAGAFREDLEYLQSGVESTERLLSDLVRDFRDPGEAEDDYVGDAWRVRFWRFLSAHAESITRTPIAVLLGLPFFPVFHYWYKAPKAVALLAAVVVYLSVLLRPDYGIGLAFIMLSLTLIKHSLGLSLVMLFLLIPYWALISRRWPLRSVSPVIATLFGFFKIPFAFPVLAGLLTGPLVAAVIAGSGCIAFELMNILLSESTSPELMDGYSVWYSIKGSSNPIEVLRLFLGPFLENRLLLVQPALWAIVAGVTSAAKGNRRWFLGVISGFTVLIIGYEGMLSGLDGSHADVDELMQPFSFSLIILLLLAIFRPPAKDVSVSDETAAQGELHEN